MQRKFLGLAALYHQTADKEQFGMAMYVAKFAKLVQRWMLLCCLYMLVWL